MTILLVGYGKMGKMLHSLTDSVTAIYDPNIAEYNTPLDARDLTSIDVAIEFTHPTSAYENIRHLLRNQIPVVCGTTGWFQHLEALKAEFPPDTHTLIYGTNFSISMNIFFRIAEIASQMLASQGYDPFGIEMHHKHKADAPSGTAKTLAQYIRANFAGCSDFEFESVRAGEIVGYHELDFTSDYDEVRLIHNVRSRLGFAKGALYAASIATKIKGYHNFYDIINIQ